MSAFEKKIEEMLQIDLKSDLKEEPDLKGRCLVYIPDIP